MEMYDNEAEKYVADDMKQLEKVERANFSFPDTEDEADRKPNVKGIADGTTGNYYTGAPYLHPFALMTAIIEDSPFAALAVNTIATSCASTTPLFRINVKKGAKLRVQKLKKAEYITELLTYPNTHQTGYDLFLTIFLDLAIYGNAYLQIIRKKNGDIHSIYTLPTYNMRVVPYFDEKNILHFGYVMLNIAGSFERAFTEDEIIHFKTPNQKTFIYGKPPLVSLMLTIGINLSGLQAIGSWFEKGFVGGAIFSQDADADVAARNREFIKQEYSRPENFSKPLIIEGSMTLLNDGNRLAGMNFENLLQLDRDTILQCLGVPLSCAGVRSSAGQANLEIVLSEEKSFITNTVSHYHRMVYNKLNSRLFREILDEPDLTIESGILSKFNMDNEIAILEAMGKYGISNGEARELMGLPPLPNDEANELYQISTNNGMLPADQLTGINYNTGAKTETIWEKDRALQEKAQEIKGGSSGLGGKLKKKAEGKS